MFYLGRLGAEIIEKAREGCGREGIVERLDRGRGGGDEE